MFTHRFVKGYRQLGLRIKIFCKNEQSLILLNFKVKNYILTKQKKQEQVAQKINKMFIFLGTRPDWQISIATENAGAIFVNGSEGLPGCSLP